MHPLPARSERHSPEGAASMLVGEQSGDAEDLALPDIPLSFLPENCSTVALRSTGP
jgi:hypothetical protein